jgi:hypothetical protein
VIKQQSRRGERLPETGLWKVVICEDATLVRTDKEYLTHSMAKKLAEDFNLFAGTTFHGQSNEELEMLLKNNDAIIYGAGVSIGGAVARAFTREGATV